jgi:hypothetical protein
VSFLFGSTKKKASPSTKPLNVDADQVNTNQEAIPVPWGAGRFKIGLKWMTPAYRWRADAQKAKVGKGSSVTTGYKYYADLAGLVCMGPVDYLFKVIVDGEVKWHNPTGLARDATDYADFVINGVGAVRIYWGTETQPLDTTILTPYGAPPSDPDFDFRDPSTWPQKGREGHYDAHPAYRGQCYMAFKQFYFGQDRTTAPNVEVEVARTPAYFTGVEGVNTENGGVAPQVALYEAFTNERFGMNLPIELLDITTWDGAREEMQDADFRISPLVTTSKTFREFMAELLEYFDGWVRLRGGILEHGYFKSGDLDLDDLPVINDAHLTKEAVIESKAWAETENQVGIVYKNMLRNHKEDIQIARDLGNWQITGEHRNLQLQRPWITQSDLARRYATDYVKKSSLPRQSGSITVRRESAADILPGELFKLQLARLSIEMVCRCLDIRDGNDDENTVEIEFENERGIYPALYVPPASQGPGDFTNNAAEIEHARIIELPSALKTSSDIQIAVLAERNNPLFNNFALHLSQEGTTYDRIAEVPYFAVRAVLETSYDDSEPELDDVTGLHVSMDGLDVEQIESQTDQQRENGALLAIVNGEIMSIGTVTPLGGGEYQLFPLRARYGTEQQTHAADSVVWLIYAERITPVAHASFIVAETRYFKLQPRTISSEVDLSDVDAITYTFTGGSLGEGSVDGLTLSTAASLLPDGSLESRIAAVWDEIDSPDVAQYEVAIKKAAASVWDNRLTSDPRAEWVVQADVSYDVRVRAISIYGVRFAWSDVESITSAKDTTAPGAPSALAATGALRTIQLAWTNPTDNDIAYTEIWESTTNNRANANLYTQSRTTSFARSGLAPAVTRYYWVRAVDTSGNIGAFHPTSATAGVAGTTEKTGTSDLDTFAVTTANIAAGAITNIGTASITNSSSAGVDVTLTMAGGDILVWVYYKSVIPNNGSGNPGMRLKKNGTTVITYGDAPAEDTVTFFFSPMTKVAAATGSTTIRFELFNRTSDTKDITVVVMEVKR